MQVRSRAILVLVLVLPLFACAPSTGELSGQVFIVTKGGQNFKLGLVTVRAISTEKLKPWAGKKQAENTNRQKRLGELKARFDASNDLLEKGQLADEITKLASMFSNKEEFGEDLLTGLPPGDVTAKTDAEGHFTMVLPRRGQFALAAQASRDAGGTTERYYWLIWVSLDGSARREIMLSNDNLVGMGSEDAVFKMKIEP